MRFTSLVFFLFLAQLVFSQGEYNIWYFGNNAGMDFNGGAPVALTNGVLNTDEGSSSICDAAGNLLFYTDGITVWNRNHAVMPNGTGLHGDGSSIQAALVIKQPGSSTIYYVFTTDNNAEANGMKYSIVDMTLDGGLGNVTTKNVALVTPCAEKLIAIPHANCTDIWVLTHGYGNNTFYAYLVTAVGVNPAITTNVGTSHNGGSAGAFNSALGTMKASPNGSKIAVCDQYNEIFEVFDFNPATGVVSNTLSLSPIYRAFGTEFSADGTKLYVSERQGSQLWQFDLSAGSTAAIQASKTLISNAGSYNYGALQRGPDDKIYMARDAQTSLGVINNPDALGAACNYVENGFNLGGQTCQEGLPTIAMITPQLTLVVNDSINFDTAICLGESVTLSVTGANTYLWSTGDTGSIFTVSPTNTTSYSVTGTHSGGCTGSAIATINVNPNPVLSVTTTDDYCNTNSGIAVVTPSAGQSPYIYNWNSTPAQTSGTASGLPAGTYTVTVTDDNGCSSTIDAVINTDPGFTLNGNSIDESCDQMNGEAEVIVNGALNPLSYSWSHDPGLNSPTATGLSAGTYTVTVDDGSCQAEIDITVNGTPGATAGFIVNPSEADIDNAFFTVTDQSIGATMWYYTFGDGASSSLQNPTHTYTSEGTFTITQLVDDGYGCTDSTSLSVIVEGNFAFYVPNAFSPNGDNKNDYFLPHGVGLDLDTYYIRIYDRWGRTVFVSHDINQPWDGEYVENDVDQTPTSVFSYYITFKTTAGEQMEYYGHVTTLP